MRTRDSFGFTLVEMVITIVVIGIVFVIGGMALGRAFESYDIARKSTDVDWQGRVAFERMMRELREVRTATATDLSFPGAFPASEIRFIDADGNSGCFVLSGGLLQRGSDGPSAASCATGLQPLADNVTAANFYYYTNAGAVPASASTVYYISFNLQVTRDSISETYRATVQPRRF